MTFSIVNASGIWVGQSVTCDASSAVMGLTSDVSWSTSGGYLSLSGSEFYRTVTATQYWGGNASVTCSWKYRLYSGDKWKTQKKTWTFTCSKKHFLQKRNTYLLYLRQLLKINMKIIILHIVLYFQQAKKKSY